MSLVEEIEFMFLLYMRLLKLSIIFLSVVSVKVPSLQPEEFIVYSDLGPAGKCKFITAHFATEKNGRE
jgi:hypothetical protein